MVSCMVSECSGGSGHAPCCFCSAVRKVLFRGLDISEEPSPAKVDTQRCHVVDTKVDLYLAPCQGIYCLEELL